MTFEDMAKGGKTLLAVIDEAKAEAIEGIDGEWVAGEWRENATNAIESFAAILYGKLLENGFVEPTPKGE